MSEIIEGFEPSNKIKLLPCPFCGGEALECKTKVICSKCTCTVYGRNIDIARKLWNTRKPMERIMERLEERTDFLKDCTKYGNKNAKQQEHSYSTMMMYEVADLVEDLIDFVKEEGGIE